MKSQTLIITLSCEDEQNEALVKVMQDITMNAVKQAIQSNLNIDKLASTKGPDLAITPVYRGGSVLDGNMAPVALYSTPTINSLGGDMVFDSATRVKQLDTGTVEEQDVAVGEPTQMTDKEARESLMKSIERSLRAPKMEEHK